MEKPDNLIERKCFALLEKAISHQATDIHLVPMRDTYEVRFKINSKLETSSTIPPQLAGRMISFFKFLSSLDISDKRKPQSGSFHKKIQEDNFSFRVSTIPSVHMQESVVLRLQKHDKIVALENLCIEPVWEQQLRQATEARQGLIIVTGPTDNVT